MHRASDVELRLASYAARFCGRTDVWARRFESAATGRAGYAPVCLNRFRPGLCDKAERRKACAQCRSRLFAPLRPEHLRWHLAGEEPGGRPFALAAYPLRLDDSCFFACLALPEPHPEAEPQSRASASKPLRGLWDAARAVGAPALVERGRGGEGDKLWWFFAEPVPAARARDALSRIVTEALLREPALGPELYDRILPEQSLSPRIGLGRPVPLPLGGTLPFAGGFDPEAQNRWRAFLAHRPLVPADVERILDGTDAEPLKRTHFLLARAPDPKSPDFLSPPLGVPPPAAALKNAAPLRIELGARIRLPDPPPPLRPLLRAVAAFANPAFADAEAKRSSVRDVPRVLCRARDEPDGALSLPRGCREALLALCRALGGAGDVRDGREEGEALDVAFQGTLREAQKPVAEALLRHDEGLLAAGTAFGKTVLGAYLVAARKRSTLVVVNRQTLQAQWCERLAAFLGLPARAIGRLGGGRFRPTGRLDVALYQTLRRRDPEGALVGRYGFVIVDECHAVPAPTFESVVDRVRARHVLGLSATPERRDGREPVLAMQCGPVRVALDPKALIEAQPFTHHVLVRPTSFSRPAPSSSSTTSTTSTVSTASTASSFSSLLDALTADPERNERIVADALASLREGRSPVILTDRKAHLARLADALEGKVAHLVRLHGGLGKREREAARRHLAEIPAGEERLLVATGPFLGEGFDDARLDTLLLATPLSWRGRLAQYAGRLHRLCDGKTAVRIYDYADLEEKTLARMFDRRCEGYAALGYAVCLPASAVPGWPAGVETPLDPLWHETFAESVRRLCRDGADEPLARLFVRAAALAPPADAAGAARARSAAEAFLWRRLETLPWSRGLFRLNERLPPGAPGEPPGPEIDLLCPSRRLAVELDGPHHFRSALAYREDRRRDLLLQRRGYLVLRFLSSDVALRLGDLLATLLDALRGAGPLSARVSDRGP